MALIESYADHYDLSSSQAVRRLLEIAELHVDSEVRSDSIRRRAQLSRRIINERAKPKISFPTECPKCGDSKNIVKFPDGRWECNVCMHGGRAT